jgi:integrase
MSEKYVRQNEKGQWIVDLLWPNGVRNRPRMPTEHKANEISIRFQVARVDGTWPELRKKLDLEEAVQLMLFKDFGQLYLEEYVKSYNRDYDDKASRIRILGRVLDKIPVDSLQQQHVTKFVNWRKKSKVKNITINHDLIVFGHMLAWGVKQQYLEHNPLPEIQKLNEIRWVGQRPTDEIIDAVFAKLDERVIPLFTFLRETGCRREEGLSLKHNQIVLNVVPPVVVFSDNTKNGKDRQVPLTAKAIDAIKAMPGGFKFVFYHPESQTRWDTARKVWESARKAAGYPWLRIHDLRHAYGIKLAERGCPMHFISEVMGHHSIDYTRKQYARFSPESASRAVLRVLEGRKNGTELAQAS